MSNLNNEILLENLFEEGFDPLCLKPRESVISKEKTRYELKSRCFLFIAQYLGGFPFYPYYEGLEFSEAQGRKRHRERKRKRRRKRQQKKTSMPWVG